MNLKSFITALAIAGLALQSCKKIEVKPTGQVPPELAIKNEADVLANLNATYTPFRGGNFYGGKLQTVSELMADMIDVSALTGDYLTINRLNTTGATGTVHSLYTEPYIIIQRANVTLDNLNMVSAGMRNNAEGQAKFMRALNHFELVRLFAQPYGFSSDNSHVGIIIKTNSGQELARSRNTVKEVYEQVLKDMNDAQRLLPAANGNYPTSWAAKAMLARIYFQMNKFDSAYHYSNQVISSGIFAFDNSPAFVTNRFSTPKTTEAVWWLVNEQGQAAAFGGLRNDANTDQSMGLRITKAAYDEGTVNPNDLRRQWYKDSVTSTGSHIYSIKKYKAPVFELPVIHITELKLIRAESAAELNQNLAVAIADINDITNRAYGGALAPLPSTANAATIKARVRAERKLEMVFESGDRIQQIKRIGAKGEASTNRTALWNCNGMALQIPATEYNVNTNFVQNPIGGCF